MVVTDPPDPLADLARELVGHERVFSTGTSQVLLWPSATVGGLGVTDLLTERGHDLDQVRREVEDEIRFANIDIIAGTGAGQYDIGAVTARLTEAVLRDERAVLPVGADHPDHGVTLSLVGVLGRDGVERMHHPRMTGDEHAGHQHDDPPPRVAPEGRDDR